MSYPKRTSSGAIIQRQPPDGPNVALTTNEIGNASLLNDGSGSFSNALDSVLMGRARYHTAEYDPVVLFQGDNAPGAAAIDVSGNGYDAALAAGTSDRVVMLPGETGPLQGFYFDGASYFEIPDFTSIPNRALQLTGDMTIEWLGFWSDPIGVSSRAICGMGAPGADTTGNNCLYRPSMGLDQLLFDFWEFDVGTDVFALTNLTAQLWTVHHNCVIRSDDGTTSTWLIDGQVVSVISGLTKAEDGSEGTFKLGAGHTNTPFMLGGVASLKLIARALTLNEARSEYNYTLGNVYGLVELD